MKHMWLFFLFIFINCINGCKKESNKVAEEQVPEFRILEDVGGGDGNYKVPVARGFNWEVSQSWADHCEECDRRYPDWGYCSLSHTESCCDHGLDFNLPGDADLGKPVLATSDGMVRSAGHSAGWGYNVVIQHTNRICSRYAHLLEGSVTVTEDQEVCQGLQIGEIGNTGASEGAHLHFQFENCDTGDGLAMGFTDGNGVPKCTRGNDVLDANGKYSFLKLTNQVRQSCVGEDEAISAGGELPEGGWLRAQCGTLPGCPLVSNCGRGFDHHFSDEQYLDREVKEASTYLWSECALDGKADGGVHQYDFITRAEALKISMYLFGLMEGCGVSVPFRDIDPDDWYFPIIACAVRYRLVSTGAALFYPNREVTYAEAAKLVVGPAVLSGVIEAVGTENANFRNFPRDHWAYSYVQTLYTYGGILRDPAEIRPEDPVQRREYIMMTASLSPCFCGNVSCHRSCGSCDQKTYSCVDPEDDRPGVGGENSEPDEPVKFPPKAPPDASVSEPDVSVPQENVSEPAPIPDVTPEPVPERDAGHPSPPPDARVAEERPPQFVIPDVGVVDARVPDRQMPDARVPCRGYEIHAKAPNGWLEAISSGPHADYYTYWFESDENIRITFQCDELPGMLLVHSENDGWSRASIDQNAGFPPFDAWASYDGQITFDVDRDSPLYMPRTRSLTVFGGPGSGENNVLALVPSEN